MPILAEGARLPFTRVHEIEERFAAVEGRSGCGGPECLAPMFDRRVEPDAQEMIVARELSAIYDRALDEKSRRG